MLIFIINGPLEPQQISQYFGIEHSARTKSTYVHLSPFFLVKYASKVAQEEDASPEAKAQSPKEVSSIDAAGYGG